jgi:hypothetical protein
MLEDILMVPEAYQLRSRGLDQTTSSRWLKRADRIQNLLRLFLA